MFCCASEFADVRAVDAPILPLLLFLLALFPDNPDVDKVGNSVPAVVKKFGSSIADSRRDCIFAYLL